MLADCEVYKYINKSLCSLGIKYIVDESNIEDFLVFSEKHLYIGEYNRAKELALLSIKFCENNKYFQRELLVNINTLAMYYLETGEYEEAEGLLNKAILVAESLYGTFDFLYLKLISNLLMLNYQIGNTAKAFTEASSLIKFVEENKLEMPTVLLALYRICFLIQIEWGIDICSIDAHLTRKELENSITKMENLVLIIDDEREIFLTNLYILRFYLVYPPGYKIYKTKIEKLYTEFNEYLALHRCSRILEYDVDTVKAAWLIYNKQMIQAKCFIYSLIVKYEEIYKLEDERNYSLKVVYFHHLIQIGHIDEAKSTLDKLIEFVEYRFQKSEYILNEETVLDYLSICVTVSDLYLSFLRQYKEYSDNDTVYNLIIRIKTMFSDYMRFKLKARLNQHKNYISKIITQVKSIFREDSKHLDIQPINYKNYFSNIPNKSAVIEFYEYMNIDLGGDIQGNEEEYICMFLTIKDLDEDKKVKFKRCPDIDCSNSEIHKYAVLLNLFLQKIKNKSGEEEIMLESDDITWMKIDTNLLYTCILSKLYNILIEPIRSDVDKCETLYITLDMHSNPVLSIPFHILGTEVNKSLGNDFRIIYVRSLATVKEDNKLELHNKRLLVIGNPYLDYPIKLNSISYTEDDLVPLQYSEYETLEIAKKLGAKPFLGNISASSILRNCGTSYIVHISCHAEFIDEGAIGYNPELPLSNSFLLLSKERECDRTKYSKNLSGYSMLTAQDMTCLDLHKVRLVVLSACKTGLGNNDIVESSRGFRVALEYSGAQASITSLWPIDDLLGAIFMVVLYDNMMEMSISEAFQKTQYYLKNASYEELLNNRLLLGLNNDIRKLKLSFENKLHELLIKQNETNSMEYFPSDLECEVPFKNPKYWGGFVYYLN